VTLPATIAGQSVWEYFDEAQGVWVRFGNAHDLGTLLRTRRWGLGPRQSVTARKWRFQKLAGQDWGTGHLVLDNIRFWRETAELSAVRIAAFSFDDDEQTYFHVRTDRNVEVYRNHERIASISVPHTAGQVRYVRRAQVLDTQLLFHADVAPHKVIRQGAHAEWDSRPVAFDSLPTFDYTGLREGGVNEVQRLEFQDYVDGDTFNITLEGETTDSIVYSSTAATMVSHISDALEALANVGAGGVSVTNTGTDTYQVEFVGENRCQDVAEMVPKTLVSAAGLAIGATLTQGKEGGEPIISITRGYPACGTFYQGRLYMAGLKSRPQTILGSRLGDWFQFASKGSSKAISEDLDTSETTPIQELFPGQHLQVFTTSAEFFFTTEPITPPSPVKRTGRRGLAKGVPVAEISGATLIVTAQGASLAEMVYDDSVQRYAAPFLSKLATHLFTGVDKTAPMAIVDLGFRRARTSVEADRAILVRTDGKACVMHALREDEVTSFVPWETDGYIAAAAADLAGTEYLAVVRTRGDGTQETFLERVDEAAVLDAQVTTVAGAGETLTEAAGLGHLEGRQVALYVDGADAGDAMVVGGKAQLPVPALREVSAGVSFTVRGVTLPGVLQQDPRSGFDQGVRNGIIAFDLGPTGHLTAGLRGGRMYDVVLGLFDAGDAYHGWAGIEGVPGFEADAQVQFEKTRPGPLEILQIAAAVES
jgi:hypothetical protein